MLHSQTKQRSNYGSNNSRADVSAPPLPPAAVEFEPNQAECPLCCDEYNIYDLVACKAGSSCPYAVCQDCLLTSFYQKVVFNEYGQLIRYDPTQCPACRAEGAFCFDESDELNVRSIETWNAYRYVAASVCQSNGSTSQPDDSSIFLPSVGVDEDEPLVHIGV